MYDIHSDTQITIPAELFAPAESSQFRGAYPLERLACGPDTYTFTTPITWQLSIANTTDALLVTGRATAQAQTSCARCLEEASFSLSGEIEGYFLLNENTSAPEDLDEDEFDVLPEDHVLDLAPLITAALIVELPLVPLCREDCKGLCATCGANLNEGECGCVSHTGESADDQSPFAALKNFKFEDDEAH